ncbi:MAG: hypothetical protein IKG69_08685 [Atopobiaceae bacterium]|nr:hypothetical protein [Atopobiaceae bacterium]
MNRNIKNNESWYAENIAPALDARLDAFDATIADTFGEAATIEHFIYSESVSFTTVRFDRGYIGFKVTPRRVTDDTYERVGAGNLRRAFEAFGIELPYWMLRESC